MSFLKNLKYYTYERWLYETLDDTVKWHDIPDNQCTYNADFIVLEANRAEFEVGAQFPCVHFSPELIVYKFPPFGYMVYKLVSTHE